MESTLRGSTRRFLGIFWMEWRLLNRSTLFRICVVVCWGLAMLLVHASLIAPPASVVALMDPSELATEAIELQIMVFAPPMIAFLAASSAGRERRPGITETLFTTPPTSEELVLGKFLGVALCTLLLLAGTAASGWLWLKYVEQTPARFMPFYVMATGWWEALLYVACLGYAAGLALPGAAGGVVVVFYLIAMLLARVFISPVFFPFFRYLTPGYFLLGLGLVFVCAVCYHRERRGAHREQTAPVAIAAALLLAGGVALLIRGVFSYQTLPFHRDAEVARESTEHAKPGEPIPPFRLTDLRGQVFTPRSLRGRPAVFILLSGTPAPLAALPPARALAAANRKLGVARLILVFFTPDPAQAERWGEAIDPALPVISQPAEPFRPIGGLAAVFGMGRRDIGLGGLAVMDSRGNFLGERSLFDALRPPVMLSLLNGGADTFTAAQTSEAETESSIAFFRALRQYEQAPAAMAAPGSKNNVR
ncbi:MAG TPA: ABC transporter permease [Armatimonadota bacterium]|nr:ABC transporter permease [Armatimonadota bacterium]